MERRKFIKISGVSMAGLIISSPTFGNSAPDYLLNLPDEIWISSGDQQIALFSADKLKWVNKIL